MIAASSPTEGSEPSSSPSSAAVSESPSGASAIVWAPCTRVSAPSYSGREVISTIDGVRGITVRKSASIDSLTASIQCASSMMNSAGSVRASDAVLISAVNRRRRASGSIWGSATSGSAMPSRSSSSSRSCGSASGTCSRTRARAACAVEVGHAAARAQQPRHHMEGNVTGMRLAEGPKHLDPATGRQRRGLPGHPALADARRSHHIHHTTAATDRAVHHGVEGRHLPAPTDQARLGAPDQAIAAGRSPPAGARAPVRRRP